MNTPVIYLRMPKHTPTQFYTGAKDGMKLRSGRTINYLGTTDFGKDALNLLRVFRKCNDVIDEEGNISGNNWHELLQWDYEFVPTMERMAGGLFSPHCTKLLTLERHISKWRTFINKTYEVDYRNSIYEKIKEAIKTIARMRNSGHPRYCSCSDGTHAYNDDISSYYYQEYGPGFLQENEEGIMDWVATPDVDREEFERQMVNEQQSWRHDLQSLYKRFVSHREYFDRVPHKIHQEVFFALSSKSTPSACAKHILSFL